MSGIYRNMPPRIICQIFTRREINYELCNFAQFSVLYIKSLYHGTENIMLESKNLGDCSKQN